MEDRIIQISHQKAPQFKTTLKPLPLLKEKENISVFKTKVVLAI